MDISNSLVSQSVARSFQENRQAQQQQNRQVQAPQPAQVTPSTSFDSEELALKGAELVESRVQKLNATESATLSARQALESYQQTLASSQQFEEGELMGVDLFV